MNGTAGNLFKLETGKATVSVKGITVTTNSATQFVTYDKADDEAAAYTGTKNSPSITSTGDANGKVDAYYYCKNNNKMVTVMFILCDDAIITGATNRTIFFARESRSNLISNSTGTYFKYNAVVNGELKTVMVDDACSGGDASNLNGLYKSYTLNSKGVITGLNAYEGAELFASDKGENGSYLKGVGVDKTSKDYTVILDTKNVLDADGKVQSGYEDYVITVDEKAAIYAIDQDGNITESSYKAITKDTNDMVYAVIEDYLVKALVIEDVDDGKAPEVTEGNGTFDVTVSKNQAGALGLSYSNYVVEGYPNFSTAWEGTKGKVTVTLVVDGETFTQTTSYKGTQTVQYMLDNAKIPSITLDLASGGVKVKATVTVTFDGMNNDTYKLVGTSGLSILG